MTDTRRTNFNKIAVVETAVPAFDPYTETYQAVISFGGKDFVSVNDYLSADSARRQSRKIVQAIQMAYKNENNKSKGKGKGKGK